MTLVQLEPSAQAPWTNTALAVAFDPLMSNPASHELIMSRSPPRSIDCVASTLAEIMSVVLGFIA